MKDFEHQNTQLRNYTLKDGPNYSAPMLEEKVLSALHHGAGGLRLCLHDRVVAVSSAASASP